MPASLIIIGATSDRRKGGFSYKLLQQALSPVHSRICKARDWNPKLPSAGAVRLGTGQVNRNLASPLQARAEALALFHASARASESCASLCNLCCLRSGHSLRFVVLLVRCRDRTASLALRSLTRYTRDIKNMCYLPLDLHKGRAIAMSVLPTVQASGLSRPRKLLCSLQSLSNSPTPSLSSAMLSPNKTIKNKSFGHPEVGCVSTMRSDLRTIFVKDERNRCHHS